MASTGEQLATTKIRCFLVEDSDVVRAALRAILGQSRHFEIVGEAVDGTTAVSRIMAARPNVVLVDIGLPGASGIEVTKQVKARSPEMKVLMFTSNEFDRDMFDAFAAGADGYVVKRDFQRQSLESAIKNVASGQCWLDSSLAEKITRFCNIFQKSIPSNLKSASIQPLSVEEEQVLESAMHANGECAVDPGMLARLQRFAKAQVQ